MSTCGVFNAKLLMQQAYNLIVLFPDDDDDDDDDTDDDDDDDDTDDDHGDNAGDDDGDYDAGSFSPAQDDLMQKDTNGDVDEKEPLLNHNNQSDDRQCQESLQCICTCTSCAVIFATTFAFMAICWLLQTSCVTEQRKMKTLM